MPKPFDFDAAARAATEYRPLTPVELEIRGGRLDADALGAFLARWRLPHPDMPYCLWEWVHDLRFEKQLLPADLDLLERGRVFGAAGDLALRRDGSRFLWHFVGEPGTVPEGSGDDFWKTQQASLRETRVRLLLWGEAIHGQRRWREPRVGRKDLDYPAPAEWQRVWVVASHYTGAGVRAFVRWRELEEYVP